MNAVAMNETIVIDSLLIPLRHRARVALSEIRQLEEKESFFERMVITRIRTEPCPTTRKALMNELKHAYCALSEKKQQCLSQFSEIQKRIKLLEWERAVLSASTEPIDAPPKDYMEQQLLNELQRFPSCAANTRLPSLSQDTDAVPLNVAITARGAPGQRQEEERLLHTLAHNRLMRPDIMTSSDSSSRCK